MAMSAEQLAIESLKFDVYRLRVQLILALKHQVQLDGDYGMQVINEHFKFKRMPEDCANALWARS